ncbi:MAG: hypothetical protein FJW34_10705 [Acidobacteria bacterium]|nr:hypothetical protein [Acidobacteriota bacterium]
MRSLARRLLEEPLGKLKLAPPWHKLQLVLALLVTALPGGAAPLKFWVMGREPGAWPEILSAVGFQAGDDASAGVYVIRGGASGAARPWRERLEQGAFLVLEGESEVAADFGFRPGTGRVRVGQIRDARMPELPIVWEEPLEVPRFETPAEARVFARERWQGAPVLAGFRQGAGAVLWVAASPGRRGYERFPYLIHALADLGLSPPFRSRRLWAFFDSSYRARVDLDYFGRRWRQAGIAALHVAAWHFMHGENDAYLRELIASCHRHGILVYAWLELPHVSEQFWRQYPEWREKTALLQDAHLDWRKLMNLVHPDGRRQAARLVRDLVDKFDWDGVNLAELYFESLEGVANPARFTPLNEDVRREFRRARGFDPLDLFQTASPRHHARNPDGLRAFLDYRAELARRLQSEWLAELDSARARRPDLDLVLTHVDDCYDAGIRDAIGADAARLLPLLDHHSFTFLVEDPATVWHLGPQRYAEIARRYQSLTRHTDRLAVDINIVERYQEVYPTKKQTGTELLQLVNQAARSFSRVALYFENSILGPDLPLLPAAAAVVSRADSSGGLLKVDSPHGVGVPWEGPARVNGRLWPARDATTLWLPPGLQTVTPAAEEVPLRLLDLNAELHSAMARPGGLEFTYRSSARALAVLDRRPERVQVDGVVVPDPVVLAGRDACILALPRGQHWVVVEAAAGAPTPPAAATP